LLQTSRRAKKAKANPHAIGYMAQVKTPQCLDRDGKKSTSRNGTSRIQQIKSNRIQKIIEQDIPKSAQCPGNSEEYQGLFVGLPGAFRQ
jgi:hypothetical protein